MNSFSQTLELDQINITHRINTKLNDLICDFEDYEMADVSDDENKTIETEKSYYVVLLIQYTSTNTGCQNFICNQYE